MNPDRRNASWERYGRWIQRQKRQILALRLTAGALAVIGVYLWLR